MKLTLEIWDILILIGAVQGFVLSSLLYCSRKNARANRWLAGLVFVLSLAGLGLVLSYAGFKDGAPWLYYIPFLMQMALGPLLYFYVRSLLFPERRFARTDWLHLVPVLLDLRYSVVLALFRFGLIPRSTAQAWFGFSTNYTDALAWAWFVIYLWLTHGLVRRFRQQARSMPQADVQLGWLSRLIKAFFLLTLIWAFYVIVEFAPPEQSWEYWEDYLIYVPLSVLTYWLGFAGYLKPEIIRIISPAVPTKAAVGIDFTPEETEEYARRLQQAMEVRLLYLDPALSLASLSAQVGLPPKTVSAVLNQHLQKSFNEFVNAFRVEEVKKRLREPAHRHLTISGIAFDSGFNSVATFQRTFRQVTGMSPKQFLAGQLAD
jgi:AraC-like DNA-binding protein